MRVFMRFLRLLPVAMSLITATAVADDKPIAFEADKVQVNQENGSMYATGNVVLKQSG